VTPEEYLARQQAFHELCSWFLELVPPGTTGSDLCHLPIAIEEQLALTGFDKGSPIERLTLFLKRHDWARAEYYALIERYPSLAVRLSRLGQVIVGSSHDAELNGQVAKVDSGRASGYVIILPIGGFNVLAYAAEMITLLGSYELWKILARAVNTELLSHAPWFFRLWRGIGDSRRDGLRRARYFAWNGSSTEELAQWLSCQYNLMLRRYVQLGVADPPDTLREIEDKFGIMPALPWDRRRFGHPMEAGRNLRFFCVKFLILHEIGHIICGHLNSDQKRPDDELEADHFAISFLVENASCPEAAIAGILGGWLLLSIAALIERLDSKIGISSTHPRAEGRLASLQEILTQASIIKSKVRSEALRFLDELTKRNALFTDPVGLRGLNGLLSEHDAFTRMARTCAEDGTPEVFYDQVPRWMLFGAPERLCRSIAAARHAVEDHLCSCPGDEIARKQLALFLWVFSAAQKAEAPYLRTKLETAYSRSKKHGGSPQ